jgi:hypothetical protein
MHGAQARNLILFEAYDADGVLEMLRRCDDPGPDRMHRLVLALRRLFEDWRGVTVLDRRLASALHELAVYADRYTLSASMEGYGWRMGLIIDELPALMRAIHSVFEGTWPDLRAEPNTAPDPTDNPFSN